MTAPTPAVGDVITLPEYLDGLADGRQVIDGNGTTWTATEHQSPTGRMWITGGSSLSSRGLLNGGPVTLRPDAPPAAPTAGVDREALREAIFTAMDAVEQKALADNRGYARLSDLDGPATDAVLAFLAAQPTPVPDGHVSTTHCQQDKGHYPALVDADVVERAARAFEEHGEAESEPGLNRWHCKGCGESLGNGSKHRARLALRSHQARAALAAARAGGGGMAVTIEQVDALRTRITDPAWRGESVAAQVEGVLHALDLRVQR